jgi:hypothetical protein
MDQILRINYDDGAGGLARASNLLIRRRAGTG